MDRIRKTRLVREIPRHPLGYCWDCESQQSLVLERDLVNYVCIARGHRNVTVYRANTKQPTIDELDTTVLMSYDTPAKVTGNHHAISFHVQTGGSYSYDKVYATAEQWAKYQGYDVHTASEYVLAFVYTYGALKGGWN